MVRVLLKWMGIILLLLIYFILSAFVFVIPLKTAMKRSYAIRITSFFSRNILAIFGVRVRISNREDFQKKHNYLIISNHVSYVDVLILSSLIPSVFITSVELKNTALLGTIAKCSGSIFIERRKASDLKAEIESIAFVLKNGFSVVLFPEGTTSNGDCVMQFKKSLFDSAIIAQADVFPVYIRYTRIDNKLLTQQTRDSVYYYGGVTFFKHVTRLLSKKSIEVMVMPLSIVKVNANISRKDLAAMTYKAISTAHNG